MIEYLWSAFLFFLPAGIANIAPVIANHIPGLNRWNARLDFGKSQAGQRIFGDHKTWRGLLSGTLAAGLTGLLTAIIINPSSLWQFFLFGCLLGFGALVGDAVESFVKRRVGVKPGALWFPFDQIDYIIGGLLFIYPFTRLTLSAMFTIFVIYFGLHLVFGYIAYLLKLKDRPI